MAPAAPCDTSCVSPTALWRRGQAGWPRRFPIVQFPNPPLLIALAGRGAQARSSGRARRIGEAAATLGTGVWALQEAIDGANWLRRLLGAGTLVWLASRRAGAP